MAAEVLTDTVFPGYHYDSSGALRAAKGVLPPSQLYCKQRRGVYYYLRPVGFGCGVFVSKLNLDRLYGF